MKPSIVTGGSDRHAELPSLLKQAVVAHEAGKLDEAYPLYRQFLAGNPTHPMALHMFGLLHSQRGDYPTAIALMQESLRLFPGQPDVANDLGNAVKRSGNPETALGWYRHALELQPHYIDAQRNLGLCQLSLEQVEAAISSFERCLEIDARDAVAWLCLGNARRRQDDLEAAVRCFEKALELRPVYAEAHHNLGLCRRLQLQPRDALKHYETARELGLDRAELYLNIGNALADTQDELAAIDAYRSAVIRNPLDLDSHRNLNSLLWQHELLDDHLASYRDALQREPGAEAIRRAYAIALNQTEDFEEAERVLEKGLRLAPQSAELKTLLGFALEGQGRWDAALRAHAEAVRLPGTDPNHEINYARALLACKRPEEALPHAELGAVRMPFNQRALAYLGLCWRLLGDERDAIMNDYESLVGVYDLPIPPAYANSEAFNEQLAGLLNRLHVHKRHPPEQTLRGGSQTTGDLFDRTEPEIRELVSGLEECIRTYTSRFPVDSEHPLFTRRKDEFHFAASWSVRLTRDGYHTMHIHPLGWISSAYYVQVPAEVAESDEFGGGLKFGEPDIDIGPEGAARRHVQPRAGRLALFPSYMWHGTVPFRSDEPRMTVAFDVVPEKQ
jgi:uncharacterized protein (TIGR02466 family)